MAGKRLAVLVAHAEPLELLPDGVVRPDSDARDERAATGTQLAHDALEDSRAQRPAHP